MRSTDELSILNSLTEKGRTDGKGQFLTRLDNECANRKLRGHLFAGKVRQTPIGCPSEEEKVRRESASNAGTFLLLVRKDRPSYH